MEKSYYLSIKDENTLFFTKDLYPHGSLDRFRECNNLKAIYSPTYQYLDIRDQYGQDSSVAHVCATICEFFFNNSFHFSPQFIYNLREDETSNGMSAIDGLSILQLYGTLPEYDYTYGDINKDISTITDDIREKAYKYVINHKPYFIDDFISLKIALKNHGPCMIILPLYNYNIRPWIQEKSTDKLLQYHAMTVIAWDSSAFILRNSWGENWGKDESIWKCSELKDKYGNGGYTRLSFTDWECIKEIWCLNFENKELFQKNDKKTFKNLIKSIL